MVAVDYTGHSDEGKARPLGPAVPAGILEAALFPRIEALEASGIYVEPILAASCNAFGWASFSRSCRSRRAE